MFHPSVSSGLDTEFYVALFIVCTTLVGSPLVLFTILVVEVVIMNFLELRLLWRACARALSLRCCGAFFFARILDILSVVLVLTQWGKQFALAINNIWCRR